MLFDGAEAASACTADYDEAGGGWLGEEIDGAAYGVGAVEGGTGAVEDVDSGDRVEGDGDVEIKVTRLGVVDTKAVEEDEGLLEGGATEGEVGLDAVGCAGLEVERRILAEEIDDGVGDEGVVARVDEVDGAIAFGERQGFERGGDGDVLTDRGEFRLGLGGGVGGSGLLGGGGAEVEGAEKATGFQWGGHIVIIA